MGLLNPPPCRPRTFLPRTQTSAYFGPPLFSLRIACVSHKCNPFYRPEIYAILPRTTITLVHFFCLPGKGLTGERSHYTTTHLFMTIKSPCSSAWVPCPVLGAEQICLKTLVNCFTPPVGKGNNRSRARQEKIEKAGHGIKLSLELIVLYQICLQTRKYAVYLADIKVLK